MIIYRYFRKELLLTLLATTLILLLIFMSNQFVSYLHSASNGNLSARLVLWLLWLRMPVLLGVLLPLSFSLSILLVYGRMYAESEMTVLFASGVSRAQIYRFTFQFGVLVAIVTALLSLWIGPYLNSYAARILKQGAFSPLALIQPTSFQSFNDGKQLIYVRDKARDHKKLFDVFIADQGKNGGIMLASEGRLWRDKKTGDNFLVFKNGNRYQGVPGEKNYQIVNFSEYGLRLSQSKISSITRANALPTMWLLKHENNNRQAGELQWRISIPLMVLILSLLAVPLSRVKTRRNRYAQLIPAILLYIIYGNFMFVGRAWVQKGFVSHRIGMWWVHLLMLAILMAIVANRYGLNAVSIKTKKRAA